MLSTLAHAFDTLVGAVVTKIGRTKSGAKEARWMISSLHNERVVLKKGALIRPHGVHAVVTKIITPVKPEALLRV